jgi:hypothetical protein
MAVLVVDENILDKNLQIYQPVGSKFQLLKKYLNIFASKGSKSNFFQVCADIILKRHGVDSKKYMDLF